LAKPLPKYYMLLTRKDNPFEDETKWGLPSMCHHLY